MNSLFSPFDARLLESFGWNLKFSGPEVASKITGEEIRQKSSAPAPEKTSGKEGKQGMKRNPRFAVELDGVHCFETILPF